MITARPILFSAPMIRALLEGRKTQTRRIVKNVPPPPANDNVVHYAPHEAPYLDNYCGGRTTPANPHGMTQWWCWWTRDDRPCEQFKCPYGVPGGLLWVRETWKTGMTGAGPQITYKATPDYFSIDAWDGPDEGAGPSFNYDRCQNADFSAWLGDVLSNDGPWRPSIFMPRWANRLTLEITDVRVERLQDISESDAIAEGYPTSCWVPDFKQVRHLENLPENRIPARLWYRVLWDQINGIGAWDENPFVWCISFRTILANIDSVLKERAA